jgi:hypothetical protein
MPSVAAVGDVEPPAADADRAGDLELRGEGAHHRVRQDRLPGAALTHDGERPAGLEPDVGDVDERPAAVADGDPVQV